jgi:hypothetical protein
VGECREHSLLMDAGGWWVRVVRDTRDEERGYKGNIGEGDTQCRRKGKRPSLVRVEREMEETSMRTDSGEERIAPR